MSYFIASIAVIAFLNAVAIGGESRTCDHSSVTTVSGSSVQGDAVICPGDLIFEDNFDQSELSKWTFDNTISGSGNNEFEWYTDDKANAFNENGSLHIKPTLTADIFGEEFISSGTVTIPSDKCTDSRNNGCGRTAAPWAMMNPVRSARMNTHESFNFKYGKVAVRAKLPTGDWLWPAIWLMPKDFVYGGWPASGELDIMEARGNLNLVENGGNIGPRQFSSTIHFGPSWDNQGSAGFVKNSPDGKSYGDDYHIYQVEWTPEKFVFSVDDQVYGTYTINQDFWSAGHFADRTPNVWNPYTNANKNAPYDQEFYVILNLAVGGNFFPDNAENPGGKPWSNSAAWSSVTDFWNGRNQWLPTWNLDKNNGESASFLIDYVRVYAV